MRHYSSHIPHLLVIASALITGCTSPQPSAIEDIGPLRAEQICPQPISGVYSTKSQNIKAGSDSSSVIRAYGGGTNIYVQGRHSLLRSRNGNSIIAAKAAGYGPHPNTFDISLINVLPGGGLGWASSIGGPENESTDAIIASMDNGYVITGTAIQKKPSAISGLGKGRLIVIKSDQEGVLEWQKVYAVSNEPNDIEEKNRLHGEIDSIVQTPDGGYVIAGNIAKDSGSPYRYWDILVAKLDFSGNVEWASAIGGKGKEAVNTIVLTDDGGYALVGVTYPTGIMNADIVFMKLDSDGQVEFSRSYSGPRQDNGLGIVQEPDGSFVIGGWTRPEKLRSGHDLLLMKIDSVGKILWSKAYDSTKYPSSAFGEKTEYFMEYPGKGKHMRNSYDSFSLLKTDDHGFAITALISRQDNVIALKTDDKGDVEWVRTKRVEKGGWGYTRYASDYYGLTIDQNSSGEYIVAGNVRDPNTKSWIFTWQFSDSSPIDECLNEVSVRTVIPLIVGEDLIVQGRRVHLVSDNEYNLTQKDILLEKIRP